MTPKHPTGWAAAMAAAAAATAAVCVLVIAFMWPSVTSDPKGLPLVVAGPGAERVASALEANGPGVFELTTVPDRATAVDRIEQRDAYGAIVVGPKPEVLVTSAGSPAVAQMLTAMVPTLQAQLQNAADAQAGATGAPAPTVTVTRADVVPLLPADARGTGLGAAGFPMVLGGIIGAFALAFLVTGLRRRLVGLALYAVVGGAALAGIMQGWFGVLAGSYATNAAAYALTLAAVGATALGGITLFGVPGYGLGPVLFVLIANPISSAATPIEFLPVPWGEIGQWFPPGAAATLLRTLSYFPAASTSFQWLVLGGWAALGVLLVVLGGLRRRAGAGPEPAAGARADETAALVG